MSKRRGIRIAVVILALAAITAAAIFGYLYLESQREYTEGNELYDQIADLVKNGRTTTEPQGRTPQVEIPDIGIDFDALKNINEDSIGWLYCPGTEIDYPVMKAEDYNYYLTRLPDGSYNKNGSLFLDYNCNGFTDTVSIIYGHNMKSKRMFGTLTEYKTQTYYQEHPYMYLYTEHGNYRIDLSYGFVLASDNWDGSGFKYKDDLDGLLEYAAGNTTFASPAAGSRDDRYIVLSTCSYEFADARYAVMGGLRPEYADQQLIGTAHEE